MYSRYARLFHRPKVLTVESSRPLAAAVMAAPMRKLCPMICNGDMTAALVQAGSIFCQLCSWDPDVLKIRQALPPAQSPHCGIL